MATVYGFVFDRDQLVTRMTTLGVTTSDLANRTGLNERNLERIITGRRPTPYPTTIARIADALGCDIDDLTGSRPLFVPAKLVKTRALLKMSLTDLAIRAGVSYRELHRLELGQRQPRPETLARLAKALHCTTEDLTVPGREDTAA